MKIIWVYILIMVINLNWNKYKEYVIIIIKVKKNKKWEILSLDINNILSWKRTFNYQYTYYPFKYIFI